MRYIQKLDAPKSFLKKTNSLTNWSEYHNCCKKQKRALKRYILKYEQNYLCIYCESKINLENSHLEHIKPKAKDKYPQLTFTYKNLVVSCNGTCHNLNYDKDIYSCGHIKDNAYDDSKFLNPVEVKNIREYFKYDIDEGKIESSSKDIIKFKYMRDTLHLNEGRLTIARKNSLKSFMKVMKKIKDKSKRKIKMIKILNKEDKAQISFLRFKYKNIVTVQP